MSIKDAKSYLITQEFDEDDKERFWVRGSLYQVDEFAKSLLYSGTENPERVEVYNPRKQLTIIYQRDGVGGFEIDYAEGTVEPCETYCMSFTGSNYGDRWHSTYGPMLEGVVPASEYVSKTNAPQDTSDGSHTFEELYDHRTSLFAALARTIAKTNPERVFRSWKHADGTSYEGYFIAGIYVAGLGWLTYHNPEYAWNSFEGVPEWNEAPEWDGHTPDDVLMRLANI